MLLNSKSDFDSTVENMVAVWGDMEKNSTKVQTTWNILQGFKNLMGKFNETKKTLPEHVSNFGTHFSLC